MGTQGVVSLVMNGQVAMKALAGCNGEHASLVALTLRRYPSRYVEELYDLALRCGFGCRDCLVVMDAETIIPPGEIEGDARHRYRRVFDDPTANPRWTIGTAEYVEVVNVEVEPGDYRCIHSS